ncbi:hypothetical protein [Aurantiacibacter marinus]|uniref:PAS fold-4 domain-containing protein n=1 Tax=Aurantiacibacter marinus TaxID=874156 RepID=A0A0H0XRS4_9SPHN|nr:hypothetical protein [Aurantiacibacter marinus]KLI65044.1 hypothetical protein AAV99_06215 [Aurantiacibacter marinus]
MTELARTPANLRRLFRTIDFAPIPEDEIVSHSLQHWRKQRGNLLAPDEHDVLASLSRELRDHSFIAEALPNGADDFMLRTAGSHVRAILGCEDGRLSRIAEPRLAARLRHLFHLATKRGEAVDVRFLDRGKSYEALAAPVTTRNGASALICTFRREQRRPTRC